MAIVFFLFGVIVFSIPILEKQCINHKRDKYLIKESKAWNAINGEQTEYFQNNSKELVENFWVPVSIKGKVINKFITPCTHQGDNVIDIEQNNSYIPLHLNLFYPFGDDLYYETRISDSIFKRSGSLVFSVKRDSLIKNFNLSANQKYLKIEYFPHNSDTL